MHLNLNLLAMQKSALTLLLAFFLSISMLSAQYKEAPNGLAFRWTWNNFQYPLTQKLNRFDYTSGAELTYVRHLGNYLNLAVPLKIGKAELPLNDQGTAIDESMIGSLDALLHLKFFKKDNIVYPYLLAGAGLMTEMDNDWKMHPEFPAGLGVNFRVAPHLYLSAETQYRFNLSENRNQLQHAAGIWFIMGRYDKKEEIADRDGDGVSDKNDECPDQAGPVVLKGCPDSDGDGIADKADDCPMAAGLPTLKGCPDKDGDNIPDHMDRCPDEFGLASAQGCPDSDGDGVIDPEDRCPNTPGPAANFGCPELKPEEKEVLEFAKKAVQFETGSAKLLPESFKVLDEIAGLLRKYPEHKLRISGHTDSIGTFEENQTLSERRAKTCYDYIVSKGIQAKRITHRGFGESKPIADNRFAPGREQNRRVEFEIYVE